MDEKRTQEALDWKKRLTEILSRHGRKLTSEKIAERMNTILLYWDCPDEVKVSTIRHYRAKSESNTLLSRIPKNELFANALVYALEGLGTWKGFSDDVAQEEKLSLVTILGYSVVSRPMPSNAPMECETLDEAKEQLSLVLYNTAIKQLKTCYLSQKLQGRIEIIEGLEKIIENHRAVI